MFRKTLYSVIFALFVGFFIFNQESIRFEGGKLPERELSQKVDFIVTGDIMLGRFVEVLIDGNGEGYPFGGVKDFLKSTDFVVGNLEGPIVSNHTPTPSFGFGFSFASTTVRILKENNISLVSLANNHTLDQKDKGFIETQNYLRGSDIEYFGHPVQVGEISVLRKTVADKGFVFIGLNATWKFEEKQYEELIKKESDNSDFLAVIIHWGDEYETSSNKSQKELARMFIDTGADVVFGHHPHVVQEVELYKNKPIFYSLGNFIFDQYFSKDVKEGLLVKVLLKNEQITYELFPVISPRSQPSLMEGNTRDNFLMSLSDRSSSTLKKEIQQGIFTLSN